jgi:hypothetical protein
MKRLGTLFLAVTLMAALLARSAAPVAACVCAPIPLEEHVATAGTILVGTVTAITFDPALSDPDPDQSRRTIMNVAVERYLKGAGGPTVEVVEPSIIVITVEGQPTTVGKGSCSTFQLNSTGRRYLLFLPGTSSPFPSSGTCSGSGPVDVPGGEEAIQNVEDILAGPQALPDTGGAPAPEEPPIAASSVAGLTVFLLGTAFLCTSNRRWQGDRR